MSGLALKRPLKLTQQGVDLRVGAFVDGVWDFYSLNRLRVDSVTANLNESPRAKVSLQTAPVKSGETVVLPRIEPADYANILNPDTRIVVFAENPAELPGADPASRVVLFDGYPTFVQARTSGMPGAEGVTVQYTCTSLLERLAAEKFAQVQGRWIIDRGTGVPLNRHVEAMPCIFNYKGLPNRSATFDTVDQGPLFGKKVPKFTWDGDPDGGFWTVAQALTYLLVHYVNVSDAYPIRDGNGIAIFQDIVEDEPGLELDVTNPTMNGIGLSRCDELVGEGQDVVSVLKMLCAFAGLTFQQFTPAGAGDPDTQILFAAVGDGGPFTGTISGDAARTVRDDLAEDPPAARPIGLEGGTTTRPTAYGRGEAAFLAANEVCQYDYGVDTSSVVTSVSVYGLPERYEVTIGEEWGAEVRDRMLPGWLPDTTFGDSQSSVAAWLSALPLVDRDAPNSGTPNPYTLWSRYCTSGPSHSSYQDIGRLWVVNEDGVYDGDYGHTGTQLNAWAATFYAQPYDWNLLAPLPKSVDRATGNRTVAWVTRPRRILDVVTKGPGVERVPPLVRVSGDSGTSWVPYGEPVQFLDDRLALRLTSDNLAKVMIRKGNGEDISVWAAIVSGTFRISLTCCVEGDSRVIGSASAANTFTTLGRHRNVLIHDGAQRNNSSICNSVLKGLPGYSSFDRDDSESASALAYKLAITSSPRKVSGRLAIPWLSNDWWPGDLCSGIMPLGVNFASMQGGSSRFPQVVKVSWTHSDSGCQTELTLDDERLSPRKA